MKKTKFNFTITFLIGMACSLNKANSQSTSSGPVAYPNVPYQTSPLDYLGWDNTTYYPLEIRTNAAGSNAQNINFYTNNNQKMTILGSNTSTDGYVGIGTVAPNRRLEVYDNTYPQLRIVHTGTAVRYAEFESTGNGDLNITSIYDPGGAPVAKFVGIHQYNPISTLHVSTGGSSAAGAGEITADGLTTNATPPANPALVWRNSSGTLKSLAAASSTTDVLTGDGLWKPLSSIGGVLGAYNGLALDNSSFRAQLGTDLSAASSLAALQHDHREIPMNEFDILFTETNPPASDDGNNIKIGTSAAPAASDPRLTVYKASYTAPNIPYAVAGDFRTEVIDYSPSASATTIIATANQPASGQISSMQAGYFDANGETTGGTIGVYGRGNEGVTPSSSWGGLFRGIGTTSGHVTPLSTAIGVEGEARYADQNFGVVGRVQCTNCFDYAGYFIGDVIASSFPTWSDSSIKTNITSLSNLSSQLMQLKPRSYLFNHTIYPQLTLSNGINYGLIAQDVESIFPNLVQNIPVRAEKDSLGHIIHQGGVLKGLNYPGFVPLLIQGWQEQEQKIAALTTSDSLKDVRLTALENIFANCCGGNLRTTGDNQQAIPVKLSSSPNMNQLFDAHPNPFNNHVQISFFILQDVNNAQIIFTDNTGQQLQKVEVTEKGNGTLDIDASDLSSGIYSYSLYADGKLIATKKLVKQN